MTYTLPTEAERAAAEDKRRQDYIERCKVKFSTERLEADIAKGDLGITTHPRQARELLRLPDNWEVRKRAYDEANTMQNFIGGLLSGCISRAVGEVLRNIEAGEPDKETYYAAAARRHREAEAEMRRITGKQIILFPPEMRRD